jgi:hypothetical protein
MDDLETLDLDNDDSAEEHETEDIRDYNDRHGL